MYPLSVGLGLLVHAAEGFCRVGKTEVLSGSDVAGGADAGESESPEPFRLVAQRAESEAAVANVEAAAIPVVDGFDAAVLQGCRG